MKFTTKNHYIPCFWSAFWNINYLDNFTSPNPKQFRAREQIVFSLKLKANKIIEDKTKNVFFEKDAGVAEISKEHVLDFYAKIHPQRGEKYKDNLERDPFELRLNFENHFTEFENLAKGSLYRVIKNEEIAHIKDKTLLAFFIFFQQLRNYKALDFVVDYFFQKDMQKYDVFVGIKNLFTNIESIYDILIPLISKRWILHKSAKEEFPLSDTQVLLSMNNTYVPLSPKLLLEIRNKEYVGPNDICTIRPKINKIEYNQFINRLIFNSNREIISSRKDTLVKIQRTKAYIKRKSEL